VDIAELTSRIQIQEVLYRYARGVDRADLDLLRSVYHPDGTDEHGSFVGLGYDLAEGIVDRSTKVEGLGQHHITNHLIQFDDEDNARAESYFLAFHPHTDSGAEELGIAAGRYIDRFQRRNGEWRILARKVVMDWTREHVAGGSWTTVDTDFPRGKRQCAGDISYDFMRTFVAPAPPPVTRAREEIR
jgi:hypothetical protein